MDNNRELKRVKQSPDTKQNKYSKTELVDIVESTLKRLLGAGITEDVFLLKYWGINPLHITNNDRCKNSCDIDVVKFAFGVGELIALADKLYEGKDTQSMRYGENLNIVKCTDGKSMETIHEKGKEVIGAELLKFMKEKGCTVQMFHPQRHIDYLANIMANLEAQFSSLWGCSIYFTPAGTQGLAPHFDDVDVFVIQSLGRKRWRVHE